MTPSQYPIDYAYYFPWTRIFRSFRIATDPRKILLAAVGLVLIWSGDAAISRLPFAVGPTPSPPWEVTQPQSVVRWNSHSWTVFEDFRASSIALVRRLTGVMEPIAELAALPFAYETSTWGRVAYVWTRFLWATLIWGLFGGAIARLAAVEFARDQRGGLLQAIGFAGRRSLSLLAAPLLPIAAMLLIWGAAAVAGLIGRIPIVGAWIVAITWGLALCFGVLAVLIVLATVAGWPLMVASIATENSDAFDGFSRSFSYIFSRPLLYVWLAFVSLVVGMISIVLVDTFVVGVTAGTAHLASTGMGDAEVAKLHGRSVGYFQKSGSYPFESETGTGATAVVMRVWLGAAAMVAIGFAVSFFWTATTIGYFLLRRVEDATQFDEVWLSEAEEDDELLPLAGIAASNSSPTERPHQAVGESMSQT